MAEEEISKIMEDNKDILADIFQGKFDKIKEKSWALPLARSLAITGGILKLAGMDFCKSNFYQLS